MSFISKKDSVRQMEDELRSFRLRRADDVKDTDARINGLISKVRCRRWTHHLSQVVNLTMINGSEIVLL